LNCFQRQYPLPETIAIFSSAAMLTLFPRGRGWRVIHIIGIHLIGLMGACLWVIHGFYDYSEPFWSRTWITAFFNQQRGPLEWFLLIFVLGFTVSFWITGIRFARQSKSYHCACSRFDRGLAAFFLLFLIKLMLQTQMKVQFQDSSTVLLVFPFFIFGLTEIGLSRHQRNGLSKDFLDGYRTIGVLTGFVLGVLILGGGVFLLFLPYLKSASVVGYELIKSAARPLAPVLIALIRFLFGYSRTGPAEPSYSSPSTGTDVVTVGETGGWMLWVEKIMIWGGAAVLTIVMIAGVCLGLWYAVRWLFAKQPVTEKDRFGWGIILIWDRLTAWLCGIYRRMTQRKEAPGAVRYYAAILRWGRYSGLPHKPNETPREYGRRLTDHFPALHHEIRLIIEMFQCEVYGEETLGYRELRDMRHAIKRMRTPRVWPLRAKSLFQSK
jgi:hypothetical protein